MPVNRDLKALMEGNITTSAGNWFQIRIAVCSDTHECSVFFVVSLVSSLIFLLLLVKLVTACTYSPLLVVNVQEIMQRADMDSNAVIDLGEFVKYMHAHERKLHLAFTSLDRNHDGESLFNS